MAATAVHLAWACGRNYAAALANPAATELWTLAELAHGAGLQPASRRRAYWLSRAVARGLLAQVLGAAAPPPTLAPGHGAPPQLEGPAAHGLHLSLAHSADSVLVGICRGLPVGVDLEAAARPLHRPAALMARLGRAERAVLEALPPVAQHLALLRLWTLKEASGKALGRGLRLPLTATCCATGQPENPANGQRNGTPWAWWLDDLDGCLLAAVALPQAPWPVRLHLWQARPSGLLATPGERWAQGRPGWPAPVACLSQSSRGPQTGGR